MSGADVIGWRPPVIHCSAALFTACEIKTNEMQLFQFYVTRKIKRSFFKIFSSYICFGSRFRNKHFVCFAKAANAALHGCQRFRPFSDLTPRGFGPFPFRPWRFRPQILKCRIFANLFLLFDLSLFPDRSPGLRL